MTGDIIEWYSSQWNWLAGKKVEGVTKEQHKMQRGLTLSPPACLEALERKKLNSQNLKGLQGLQNP